MISLEALIEAILFWHTEPMSLVNIAKAVGRSEAETKEALDKLRDNLSNRGVVLLINNDEIMLGTHPEASNLIEKLTKEELSRDLGRASLETLTTILYKHPIARAEIDYIRGVNSSFILRHLMVRGLVERLPNPADARSYLYQPTLALWQHLGLTRAEDLPEYAHLTEKLKTL